MDVVITISHNQRVNNNAVFICTCSRTSQDGAFLWSLKINHHNYLVRNFINLSKFGMMNDCDITFRQTGKQLFIIIIKNIYIALSFEITQSAVF